MNFLELTAKRQSDRAYLSKDVTEEQLDYILVSCPMAHRPVMLNPGKLLSSTILKPDPKLPMPHPKIGCDEPFYQAGTITSCCG